MKQWLVEGVRNWFMRTNNPELPAGIYALDDAYLVKMVESLNYCRNHPETCERENRLTRY